MTNKARGSATPKKLDRCVVISPNLPHALRVAE